MHRYMYICIHTVIVSNSYDMFLLLASVVPLDIIEKMKNNDTSVTLSDILASDKAQSV